MHRKDAPVRAKICGSEFVRFAKKTRSGFRAHFLVTISWPKNGPSLNLKQESGGWARLWAHFPATVLGPFLFGICGPLAYFCELRRSFSPVASAGDCTQLATLLLLAHAACPQQDCPLFVRHLKMLHATCDVVRGLWSLSEGSAMRDRRWNANGGSVGQFLNKA